jgi:hypothetical protein
VEGKLNGDKLELGGHGYNQRCQDDLLPPAVLFRENEGRGHLKAGGEPHA